MQRPLPMIRIGARIHVCRKRQFLVFSNSIIVISTGALYSAKRKAMPSGETLCSPIRYTNSGSAQPWESHMLKIVLVVLAVILAVLLVPRLLSHTATPVVGSEAPGFTLPSQDGTPVSLANYRGKWVVLYFYPKDKTAG